MNYKRSIDIVRLFVKFIIMKKMLFIWLLSGMFISAATSQYDDAFPTGYEGDNFSLEGALDLFKNSYSLDQFERKLNTEANWVNNLDLNYDGRADYIRVEHISQGDFHAVVLQALVGSRDIQDVAVIEIEKVSRRDAILQIIGDEDLFGEEVIVEAFDRNTMLSGNGNYYSNSRYGGNYVNVYNWAPVQFIFSRNYVRYVSPYNYNYYPTWWNPWSRCGFDVFRPRVRHYSSFYRPVRVHRVRNVHQFYKPHRAYSNRVLSHSNKVRVKHGKKAVNRSRVQSRNVATGRGVASKSTTRKTSTRSNSSRRDIGSVNRNTASTKSNYNRGNTRTTNRSATSRTKAKSSKSTVSNRSGRTSAKNTSRKVVSQSKSRASNPSSRTKTSTANRTSKKSQVSKSNSKKTSSTKKSTRSRRQ